MNDSRKSKGTVVIVSGPSGVGKSTICKKIVERLNDVCLSVSVTTRPKSQAEVNGKDYLFVTGQEFQERINRGLLLEYANVFGHWYGTPKDKVEQAVAAGKTVILEIDVQGGKQVKTTYPDAVMIFILPPSQKDLVQRMNHRARDDFESKDVRLQEADAEIAAAWQYYDNMVINEDLQAAVNECVQIIEDARHRNGKSEK